MTDVTFPATEGDLRAWLAVPTGSGPWPGVVVIHEMFGLNDDIRGQADRLAQSGYLALAPDLYSWGATPRCLVATMRTLTSGEGRAFTDIDAARSWLAADGRSTGTVGILGFCMGGGFALACAPRFEFEAAAPNYGSVVKDAEKALAGACPIVASFGGQDWMLKNHAERLERALTNLGIDHDVKEYPNATHSFFSRQTGAAASILGRLLRIRYSPDDAEDAWRRIFSFFDRHLKSETSAGDQQAE